jgi:branched-chain amino acid transport system substrate-binding protein
MRSAISSILLAALLPALAVFGIGTPQAAAGGGRPLRIAAVSAFTGPAAASSLLSVEGVRFAVAEINRGGGILGRPMELMELDNQSTPIGAKVAAEEAVSRGARAIVGAEWSSHALSAARVAQRAEIPMIASVATSPDVTRVGDFIFRACFTDHFQGEVMARFARSRLPHAPGAVIFTDIISEHSMALSAEFQKWFEAMGGTVLARVNYRHSQENFEAPVREAMAAEANLIFLPGHDEAARILETSVRLGLSAIPMGGDGWGTASFLENGGDQLPIAFYCTHWAPGMETPASRAFLSKFRPRGNTVYPSHALGYDAVGILADAIRRAGTDHPGRLRKALADTRQFPAVSGAITFDENGDPIKPAVIMKIENGRNQFFQRVNPPEPGGRVGALP